LILKTIRIRTFYHADPAGVVPGGVDTFIRGLIKWAPDDIEFSLVGMTTDTVARPQGRWTRCDLGRRQFDFFPVFGVDDAGSRSRIPLTLRFIFGAARFRKACAGNFDVYEFHRIEPALLYLNDARHKNAFFHQDMAVLRSESKADILWRHLPALYFALEARVVGSLSSAWCVREQGAESLRKRYPFLAHHIHFIPTWVDHEVFFPLPESERRRTRVTLELSLGLDPNAFRLITVGRLDTQKNPDLLLSAVGKLVERKVKIELIFVGDGLLRAKLEKRVLNEGLSGRVHFLGLKSAADIAQLLHTADCFALSSAYEGMPMALLEALGAGIPVVTTPVGEVKRVVSAGVNGEVSEDHSLDAFVERLDRIRCHLGNYSVENCVKSIEPYTPAKVLEPVYANYRRIGSGSDI
jgi:glycosyltransferase involved in cell wall biosynthesis